MTLLTVAQKTKAREVGALGLLCARYKWWEAAAHKLLQALKRNPDATFVVSALIPHIAPSAMQFSPLSVAIRLIRISIAVDGHSRFWGIFVG